MVEYGGTTATRVGQRPVAFLDIYAGGRMKRLPLSVLVALLMIGCAETHYQQFEGRNGSQIVEGQGGTKEVVDGYDIWGYGTPPRRYRILGVVSIEDFDNSLGRGRIRDALLGQIKAVKGDGAVAVDAAGGGSGMTMIVGSSGQVAAGPSFGKKVVRWQIIKYVD